MTPQTAAQKPASPDLLRKLENFGKGLRSFEKTEFSMDPREDLEGEFCKVTVVFRPNGDVIFQLFPKGRKWPKGEREGRELVGDLLEVYFDSLERFSGSHVPELDSWAVRAEGLASMPTYDKEHHVYGFARYLNQSLADL